METFCVQHINLLRNTSSSLLTTSKSDLHFQLAKDKILRDATMFNLLDGRSSQQTRLSVRHEGDFTIEVRMFFI